MLNVHKPIGKSTMSTLPHLYPLGPTPSVGAMSEPYMYGGPEVQTRLCSPQNADSSIGEQADDSGEQSSFSRDSPTIWGRGVAQRFGVSREVLVLLGHRAYVPQCSQCFPMSPRPPMNHSSSVLSQRPVHSPGPLPQISAPTKIPAL